MSIWVWLFSMVGVCIWIVGIVASFCLLIEKGENVVDRFSSFIVVLFISGMLGWFLSVYGILKPVRNSVTTYESPTSIVRTNNLTIVNHFVKDKLVISNFISTETSYWNSTNIQVKVVNGHNFFYQELRPTYDVVIK